MDTTDRRWAAMAGSPAATATDVKTVLSFLEMFEDLLLERVDVRRQRSSSTSCYNPTGWIATTCTFFWKESPPTGVQGVEERIRSRFEQTANFQSVR